MSPTSARERIGAMTSPELLRALEEAYPVRAAIPTMNDTERQIGKKIGELSVVDFIRSCVESFGASRT